MFYTFDSATSPAQRNTKRIKVRRACNNCRLHRVRCDAETPCSRCAAGNIECVIASPSQKQRESLPDSSQNDTPRPSQSETPTVLVLQDDSISRRSQDPAPTLPSPHNPDKTPAATNVEGAPEAMDSTAGFMSKISAFCSAIPQLSTDVADELPPPYPSLERPMLFNTNTKAPSTILTKPQALHILEFYWGKYHQLMPIVSRPRIESYCQTLWASDGSESQTVPLIDGMLAISLQYLESSGLNRRLLGLRRIPDGISLSCFRRCLASTTEYATFADPALDHIQCYVFMTLYLLNSGQHQAAYSMIGLAMRISHTLNLHHGKPATDPEASLAHRLWWTVVHLDFRCARLLGRPVGVQLTETTCPLPAGDEFSYHTGSVSLTGVILSMNEALSQHAANTKDDHARQVESRASSLSFEVYRLKDWQDKYLSSILKRPLHVDQKLNGDSIYQAVGSNLCQFLHSVLLELQYYDEIIGLHRPFICFPKDVLVSERSPQADNHGTTALNYAMATVDLVHRVMSATDAFFGRTEVYQWQWNALLTLIGFLMAYPLCEYCSSARHHTQLALEIFEGAGLKHTVAARAAALGRSLCAKVDSLVQILKSDGQHAASPSLDKGNSHEYDDAGTSMSSSNLSFNSDVLWSWTDMTNQDVWSAYSDGITGVLADFPDLPFGNDGFSTAS